MTNRAALVQRALAYPYDVATESFALVGGERRALAGAPAVTAPVAIVASGSNAAPARLAEKLRGVGGDGVVHGVVGTLDGFCPVYSAHLTSYGAAPATLVAEAGCRARLVCLQVPRALLPTLHRSEALDTNYGFDALTGARFVGDDGRVIEAPHAYLSLHGPLARHPATRRLDAFTVRGSAHPAASEATVLESIRRALAPALDLDEFIVRCVEQRDFRRRCTERLRTSGGRPTRGPAPRPA